MKRRATIVRKSEDGKRAIAIDDGIYEELMTFLTQTKRYRNKFIDITNVILQNLRNSELYDKEEPDKKSKGVRAMKFFKGQENHRIYCREVTMANQTFVVIASALHKRKKTQKLKQRERNVIHKVARYEYDTIQEPDDSK